MIYGFNKIAILFVQKRSYNKYKNRQYMYITYKTESDNHSILFILFYFFKLLKISYQLNFLYSNSSLVSLQVWSLFIQIICNFWSNHFFMCYLKIIFFQIIYILKFLGDNLRIFCPASLPLLQNLFNFISKRFLHFFLRLKTLINDMLCNVIERRTFPWYYFPKRKWFRDFWPILRVCKTNSSIEQRGEWH